MRIFSLIFQGNSTSSMTRSASSVFSLIRFHSAMVHRRRWPIHFCTPDRAASFTQAFVVRAEPALRAFGRLLSSTRAAPSYTASRLLLGTKRLRVANSLGSSPLTGSCLLFLGIYCRCRDVVEGDQIIRIWVRKSNWLKAGTKDSPHHQNALFIACHELP